MTANPTIKICSKYNQEKNSYEWFATVNDGNEISIPEAYALYKNMLDKLAEELITEQNQRSNESYER